MKQRIVFVLIALLAAFAVGCGDSKDDVVTNPGNSGGGNSRASTTFLRLAHLVPAGQNYDIYANNRIAISNLSYSQFTDYLAVATNARIEVTQAGNRNVILLDRTLTATTNGYGTLALTGTPGPGNVLGVIFADAVAEFPALMWSLPLRV